MSRDAVLLTVNCAGPVVLLIVWFTVRNRIARRRLVACAWGIVLAVGGAIGTAQYMRIATGYRSQASTLLCHLVMMTSSVVFLGPLLVLSVGRKWHWAWSILATIILVPVSYVAAFFLMLETCQLSL
jgi:hypothetical protein